MASYRNAGVTAPTDGRLFAPTFARNSPPMVARLAPWLGGRSGPVLEIGAGTGQHAAAFALAFPQLQWWPSDPDSLHRASADAWQKELRAPHRAAFDLDAAQDWTRNQTIRSLGLLSGVISMNVIHIAPYSVAKGIVNGAGKFLNSGGLLIFYGPFLENGAHTGPGNEAFDRGLRAENPDWGVRDTRDIAELSGTAGLTFAALIAMPANNRLLIFRKT
jgi:hypothetical protein